MPASLATHHQETILNSITEGVFTVDAAWRITAFNRAAERIIGVKRAEAIGRPCCEVFRSDICEAACALKMTLASGVPRMNVRATLITQAGTRIPVRLSTAPLKNADGAVVGGVETFQDLSEVAQLQKELESTYTFEDIIGRSPAMIRLFRIMPQIAESDSTVLIVGASGTGKELFARAIHNLSARKNKPFVAVNCAALPDTLLESELFGYKAGAFTGAQRDKPGRFAMAEGGTIFLDEIGDISPAMQVRLLRVLQERQIEPLGAVASDKVDIRVLAAANRDLDELVREKRFRKDFYYRIRVMEMALPELAQRRTDIPILVDHLVAKFNKLKDKDIAGVSESVMARLMVHDYPGNVRELENIIEHAFVLCSEGLIGMRHLPPELNAGDGCPEPPAGAQTLKGMERLMIVEALFRHSGNRRLAAAELGIDASTLYRKIRVYGITPPETDGRGRGEG